MKRLLLPILLTPIFLATSASVAEAANVDYFLKIPGVEGESTDQRAPGTIELLSWSWGETNDSTSGTNRVDLTNLRVTTTVSKASPKLVSSCADGTFFETITLYAFVTEDNEEHLYQWELSDVLITSYSNSGNIAESDERPTEEHSFYYNKIGFSYHASDGAILRGEATRTRDENR